MSLAQGIEQFSSKELVSGSNPLRHTSISKWTLNVKLKKLPKQRSKLYEILANKRKSGAAGKHKDQRKIEPNKLVRKGYYND